MKKILVVEDSERLNKYIASHLKAEKYESLQAWNGREAFDILKKEMIDLIILDINLGDISGLDILQTIRRQDQTLPVMIISSINDNQTKICGFNIGCDDYLTKPFYIDELIGRIKRMLKRQDIIVQNNVPVQDVLSIGPFEVDISNMVFKKNGTPLVLRKKQFEILLYLLKHHDENVTAEALVSYIWGNSEGASVPENSLYVQIRQIRSIIEDDPSKPQYLITVRNSGYIFYSNGI